MTTASTFAGGTVSPAMMSRAETLCKQDEFLASCLTDRRFVVLMLFQWLIGIGVAIWVSPRTWIGPVSEVHPHVYAAVILGGVISFLPITLALLCPGKVLTRHVIAVGQVLTSSLLIHLSGGRIETHFHVFGSLAFLASYRDWRVLVSASAIVAIDHFTRGAFWPMSVYGAPDASFWRSVEHAGWVVFEDVFLILSIVQFRIATREVANRQAQVEATSQAKSEFLATMSHELRTPLNGILGMNELLLTTELNERQRQYVAACNSSGKVLLQNINDILDLSKIEAGKLELDLCEADLETVLYDAVEIMSYAAREKRLVLTCHLTSEAGVVGIFDDNRLRQVLVNLIGNAIKFTSSGSITVGVARVAELEERKVRLRFSVSDTGVGIPPERLDRLFKAFSQVDSSTTRRFGGTGLGLSISKQLVELMGGEIGVDSQVGIGTTFWFEIPIETKDDSARTARSRELLAGTPMIVVDGDERERQQVGEFLESWGCPFQHVATVADALTAARAGAAGSPIRLVLADCRLVTGSEFVQLRELAALPDVQVIGLGAPSDTLSTDHLYGLGIRRVLHAPLRPSALFNALISVLSVRENSVTQREAPAVPLALPPVKLSGHILVAEDNRINQLYIVELLKHFGCSSEVVVNGEQALAAVQQQCYDLVLMDCQMPEMDGFSATREIRKWEAASQFSRHVPITALTANALKGDRERCLEAGMDGYVSKPVESDVLKAVLEEYLGKSSAPHTASEEGQE